MKIMRKEVLFIICMLLSCSSAKSRKNAFNGIDPQANTRNNKLIDFTAYKKNLDEINVKALGWLETLHVDPIKIRKGKKKYVELLEIYYCLYRTADDDDKRKNIKTKLVKIIKTVDEPEYHDIADLSDKNLRQISTSYLRAWYIISKCGFNTSFYYNEIKKVKNIIDAHLRKRGNGVKMAFFIYYQQLGFCIGYSIEGLFKNSLIRKRKQIECLTRMENYHITHEIFALREANKMCILTKEDRNYLRNILSYFANKYMDEKDIDILSELLMVMNYLDFTDMDEYWKAVEFLMQNQNSNGSFGYYEAKRSSYAKKGYDIDYLWYLHTTEVALLALNETLEMHHGLY